MASIISEMVTNLMSFFEVSDSTHAASYLPNVVVLLFAAVFIVFIFKRLHLSPVLGYLVAGAAIGEHGLGYMQSIDVKVLAEFGVVFLLFAIGIELTLERLMAMRTHVFGFGTLQTCVTGSLIGVIAYQFDIVSPEAAIVIGGAFALSSTAIVMSVISDNGRKSSQVGRLSIAVLILQDFAVVPLLILVPLLADQTENIGMVLTTTMLKALVGMVLIFFVGRLVMRPFFNMIVATKNDDLFIATVLLIVLGASFATESLGLSLALGAFIAGLLVAETQYHHQVEEAILPFKGLLMALFFISVGMTVDLNIVLHNIIPIVSLSIALIAIKTSIIISLCWLFRFSKGASIQAGLLLSQGSEFAFIMITMANTIGIMADELSQVLLLVVTTTMALTPMLSQLGIKIADKFDNDDVSPQQASDEMTDLERHILICGYGRVGKMVARLFSEHKLNFLAVDINSHLVRENRKEGMPVYRGDASRPQTLKYLGLERAVAVIITIENSVSSVKIIKSIRAKTDVPIIVRVEDFKNAKKFKEAGATHIVPETYETGLQLGGKLLRSIGISEYEISLIKNRFRAGDYAWAKDIDFISQEDATEIKGAIDPNNLYIGGSKSSDEEKTE